MLKITEDQEDILKEIFNMGMGKSLKALSLLANNNSEIEFSLPKVEVITLSNLLNRFTEKAIDTVNMIEQEYSGAINGRAYMLYPDNSSLELANLILGTSLPPEELSKLENDALIEIGNMLINAAISAFGNFLGKEVFTGIPKITVCDPEKIFSENPSLKNQTIIYISAQFDITQRALKGNLALMVDDDSFENFLKQVDEYYDKFD